MADDFAAARKAAQEAGRQTLQRIRDEEYVESQRRLTEPRSFKTAADVEKLARDRHNAETLAATLRQQKAAFDLAAQPVAVDSNPYRHLSSSELLEMDRLQRLEASQKEEFEKQFVSFASWVLQNPSFPAAPQAADVMVQHLKAHNRSLSFDNLSAAWTDLKASGVLRPDFSQKNRMAMEANVEELRANGLDIQPAPDPRTASLSEVNDFLKSQPAPTLDLLQPQAARTDLFEMPLSELNGPPTREDW